MATVRRDGRYAGYRSPVELSDVAGESPPAMAESSESSELGGLRGVPRGIEHDESTAAGSLIGPWLLASLALSISCLVSSCGDAHTEPLVHSNLFDEPYDHEPQDPGRIEVQPPPFSDGVFPCTDCHESDLPVKGVRRQLMRAHQDVVLEHDEQNRWCLDCHSLVDFDKLHLASGELIDFEESYKLCGQCHGDKYRDWRSGVHGRRSGNWDGEKTYLLCVHCHYSHAPAFQPLVPKRPPQRPERTP